MPFDTLVIGAGLAGLTAAARSAQAGRRTLLVAKGQGSLHWSSGCIDLWPTSQPRTTLAQQIVDQPEHPYARAGLAALDQSLKWLQTTTRAAGYPLAGSSDRCLYLPTAIGTWRPTAFAPLTMIAAERQTLSSGPVLVAGFRELRDFYPALLAAQLNRQGISARSIYLTMPPIERQLDFSTIQLARLFERPAFRTAIGRQLRSERQEARLMLLPAVLGLDHSPGIVADLQAAAGALVAEIPTLPTNVPGLRLYSLLRSVIQAAGGQIQLNAEVLRGEWEGTSLRAVWTQAAAREQRHEAERFVLATGGLGGGGLRAEYPAGLRETALGLPVQQPEERAEWFDPNVLATGGHRIYRAGILTDDQLRPAARDGSLLASNVLVAGAALAGADLIRERCVEGVALASGWRAGGEAGHSTGC